MNNIQLSCSGNMFTKPLACWSLLDVLAIIFIVGFIFIVLIWAEQVYKRKMGYYK